MKKVLSNRLETKDIIIIVTSFLIGGILMLFFIKYTEQPVSNNTKVYEKTSLKESINKVYDSVVVIESFNDGYPVATGTGFFYKTDDKYGYILTNEHTLTDTDEVIVTNTKDEEISAKVLGKDKYLDLAVLRVNKKHVPLVAKLSSSKTTNIGDTIFTVGTPIAKDYRGTVTSGIISGKDRNVSISLSESDNNDWIMEVLQIDASINPGNSGGPLLNVNGEVIGIVSMKLIDDDIEGIGFAIPIEYAKSHLEEFELGKKIEWPYLGIEMINVSEKARLVGNGLEVPSKVTEGVVVYNIKDNSPVKHKLKKGDIITEIDGVKVEDIAYLKYELYKHSVNSKIEITYIRNKIERKTHVNLKSSD